MYCKSDCLNDLSDSLKKIIIREHDIDKNMLSSVELEHIDVTHGKNFIVFVNDLRLDVHYFMPIKSAEYIYKNIGSVTYIQSENYSVDTLVGDISEFIVQEFGFAAYSNNYFVARQLYSRYISTSNYAPTVDGVVSYIKGLL